MRQASSKVDSRKADAGSNFSANQQLRMDTVADDAQREEVGDTHFYSESWIKNLSNPVSMKLFISVI